MKLIQKYILATVTAIVFTGFSLGLSAKEAVGSGANPYRDCGIGAALFANTAWAAVTSNVIWDAGSTAITSATSSPETCSKKNVQAAQFIMDTYDNLAEETARGQGQHLTSVLTILECESTLQEKAIPFIRTSMAETVGAAAYADKNQLEKAAAYYDVVTSAVSVHCAA
ncbi:MAG: DUF3015 family protein [Porticoccaceae bacterium]